MAGRPTSAPVRRAAVDPPVKARIPLLFQGQGAGGADVGRVPMSARASTQGGSGAQVERRIGSKQRPASASASGRPPPYVLDTLDPPQPLSARGMRQVRGSFGAWQGKKFALLPPPDEHGAAARDSRVQFAGIQGVRTRLERPSSAGYAARDSEDGLAVRGGERRAAAGGGRRRHASFLDKASRKTMIDKIRANNAAQEAAMYEGTSTAAEFVPRLRPRSATVRLGMAEAAVDQGPAGWFAAAGRQRDDADRHALSPRSAAAAAGGADGGGGGGAGRSLSPERNADGSIRTRVNIRQARPSTPKTLNPKPSTLSPERETLSPKTRNAKRETRVKIRQAQSSTLNPQPRNPQPSTPTPEPSASRARKHGPGAVPGGADAVGLEFAVAGGVGGGVGGGGDARRAGALG